MDPRKRKHFIDFLFPLTLFLVFASLAVTLILLATNVYQESVRNSHYNDNARLSLAYITEKIHQHNRQGNIRITSFDGTDILEITHPGTEASYYTYIYFQDGCLKELFFKEGVVPNLTFGRNIADLTSFSIEELSADLLSFTCVDQTQHKTKILVGLKTTGGNL